MTHARRHGSLVLVATSALTFVAPASAQLAFDGAMGFGAGATGGRGGRVIHVTTLAASGPGSLAEAATASGARYVVFDVSGVIEGDVEITAGDVTIAGQTAPGAGITIHGHLTTPYGDAVENLVIRHLRVRPPPPDAEWAPEQHDAIQMSDARRVIFDHVDVSHGVDELVDHWLGGQDITWQRSILSFPNPEGGHPDGAHPFCLLAHDGDSGTGAGRVSILGNLFAHCRTRTPALSIGPAEVTGNVVYDAREAFVHHNAARGDFVIAGNTYVDGPSHSLVPFWFDADNDPAPTDYYLGDNRVVDPGVFEDVVENPWTTPGFSDAYTFAPAHIVASQFHPLAEAPSFAGPGYGTSTRASLDDAYAAALDCAGAWPRDHVSRTAVEEARARSGMTRLLPTGDLLAGLAPGASPTDGDRDGMPDAWESARGLDPAMGDHARDLAGRPALEVYLDELADVLTPCGGGPPPPDAGITLDGGGSRLDAAPSLEDAPGRDAPGLDARAADRADAGPVASTSGCGCRAQRGSRTNLGMLAALLALGLALGRAGQSLRVITR